VAWVLVGAGLLLAILGAMSIGFLILPFVALAAAFLLTRRATWPALPAALCGVALPALWVAWLNRDGPGNVCTITPSSTACVEEWSPWPWVVVATALILSGIAGSVMARRRARTRNEATPAHRIGTEVPPRR
jgi:hypothetical protein